MPRTWEIGSAASGVCYLEGFADDRKSVWRTLVRSVPFSIGRRADADLVLSSGRVSHRHARIESGHDSLWLRDLDSTNGTFLNGLRFEGRAQLRNGDIVHFADQEFRLVMLEMPVPGLGPATPGLDTLVPSQTLDPSAFFQRVSSMRSLLDGDAGEVVVHFQPIVALRAEDRTETPMGAESLGRAILDGALRPPFELFELASTLDRSRDLSAAFRRHALALTGRLPPGQVLFLNTHPEEIDSPKELLDDIRTWRERDLGRPAVLEIHEGAVADIDRFQRFCEDMKDSGVGIAFDDFGKGQARLLELADVEPDFVKFDRAWVQGLDQASEQRRGMIRRLLEIVDGLCIDTVVEGVETREEADAAREIGFRWAQGYLFGRPAPLPDDDVVGDATNAP